MTSPSAFFAQIETLINAPVQKSISTTLRDTLIIVGCALVLGAILFAGAFYFRKRRSHHHHQYPAAVTLPEEAPTSRRKSRRRRRRPDHPDKRPRNPSLNETGGLPPLRSESDE